MSTTAIIVAAGKGERAKRPGDSGGIPKQYRTVGGKALVAHAAEALASHPAISELIIVVAEGQAEQAQRALGMKGDSHLMTVPPANDGDSQQVTVPVQIISGGILRQDSVLNGLKAANGADAVLIHDAARPFIPHPVIDQLLVQLGAHQGAVPVLPVADTLAKGPDMLGDLVPRDDVFRIQTPQAFRLSDVMAAHQQWKGGLATDDAQMVRATGGTVALVSGDAALEKITHPQDFARAEALWASSMISRTGMGFDVHRLETGEELWLCGIQIPHDRGLSGHSDADVALHALVDAILGAIGEGDIGTHFPPTDPEWRGAASSRFLEHARDLVLAKGGIIDHVDLTLICEAPKIGPHRAAMRTRIATLLQVQEASISIKATTTERLGFTGREEGIAAQAIATVRTR